MKVLVQKKSMERRLPGTSEPCSMHLRSSMHEQLTYSIYHAVQHRRDPLFLGMYVGGYDQHKFMHCQSE